MKVRLTCEYRDEQGLKIGEYGVELESPHDASVDVLRRLVASGSAVEIEPPKKSERD